MPLTSHHVTRMTEMGDILAKLISGSKRHADKLFAKELILLLLLVLAEQTTTMYTTIRHVFQNNTIMT
jgi:hypothetical protein